MVEDRMNSKSLPPLNWLRTFEVAARSLNFTKAAQELHLTQGAVSQQIRLLEGHLGVALFTRLPRGLALTDEGMSYLPVVQDSISRLAAATNELFSQDQRTPVKIRGSLSFFVHWLAPRLTDFHALHSNIDIRYISSLWVKDSEVDDDFEIRWGSGQWPGYVSQRLSWDRLFPVCCPDLLERSPIHSTSDLSGHTLLHVLGYEEGWGYWLSMMNETRVDPSRGMQLDTLLASLRMAELGMGIALARSSMVEDMLSDGRLVAPLTEQVEASESFYLVQRSGKTLSVEAHIFLDWLERTLRAK
ncbi:Glycine cleavage system transcriptional activator [Marinomonas gallaica]|uniref:Glycine cleavage system transcriptional activator n=2 Tax=Marinomonas gallaica TaxID=1806667 RepID=A0A1C3JTN5_9GAMM|nr:Glycine cleavage system transcriptional activator [Marinomonas gallaica]SBT22657.1 Glycine cleavage system transcriptional activator [Marinomonas gallaica]